MVGNSPGIYNHSFTFAFHIFPEQKNVMRSRLSCLSKTHMLPTCGSSPASRFVHHPTPWSVFLWTPRPWKMNVLNPNIWVVTALKMKVLGSHGWINPPHRLRRFVSEVAVLSTARRAWSETLRLSRGLPPLVRGARKVSVETDDVTQLILGKQGGEAICVMAKLVGI